MRYRRFLTYSLLAILFVLPSTAQSRKKNCRQKRQRCLKKCEVKSTRKVQKCKRTTLRQRQRCLKSAYRKGRRCLKQLECPAAMKCYEQCNEKGDPITCYVKKGCAKLQSECYASCQYPLGQNLKQCLTETAQKLKGCDQMGKDVLKSCRAQCPTCY